MPATEKTWRDQARMHVIFGVSALVMLVSTVWMLAKDHNREWRQWQLADRAKERWTIEAQLAQAEAESMADLDELRGALRAARSAQVDAELVERFKQEIATEDAQLKKAATDLSRLDAALERLKQEEEGSPAAKAARDALLREMGQHTREARRREDELVSRRKFLAADHTAIVSERGIAVGEGRPTARIDDRIRELSSDIEELDDAAGRAKDYRVALEQVVREVRADETEKERLIASIEADLNRLREQANLDVGPLGRGLRTVGEAINRGPVLDAMYTGDIRLDQIWLPEMTINYNFSHVARYDRCTVCHQAIDQTAPGSATEPAYPAIPRGERERIVRLATPEEPPAADEVEPAVPPSLASVYGLTLTRGQIDRDAVTVQVVAPHSLAAAAGLEMGDILVEIDGGPIRSQADARHYMLDVVEWGQPLRVRIRRGLDQPFTSHPRLDLFVGPTSPHKKGEMGCTICHDGQGSATEFKWASHTPNDPQQALDWSRQHGWFDNHHWIFPMTPNRFIESNCLKCHHHVEELEPSERFPDPPAPKLVQGYHLVREFGCYGCHEIPGYDGLTRVGPDLRTEPNFSEVASQILTDRGLSDEERSLAARLIKRPDADDVRRELLRALQADAAQAHSFSRAPTGSAPTNAAEPPRLAPATHALADMLRDVDTPGNLRKVGPSLRHLGAKVDFDWLYTWIRRPADFRPDTRMPQFFLQHEHLDGKEPVFEIYDAAGNLQNVTDREYTERFENIEIRAVAEFLLAGSQPFEYLDPPQGVTESPSAERGKWLFETRGCLACHAHAEFPGIHSTHGPDLSRVAAKFSSGKGQRWLYSWIKEPNHYHSRTVMPDLFLDPVAETDTGGNPTGQVTDPAADIVAFLLGVEADWQPEVAAPNRELSAEEEAALNDLTTVWLSASFPRRRAAEFARNGIPERLGGAVKVDERVLVGMTAADRTRRQMEFVARRSLSHYGCFGCHDIPGFETAKPIGTPLASWGRKDPSQLAFENIGQFLATHGLDGTDDPHEVHDGHAGGHGLDPLDDRYDADTAYYLQALNGHHRQGFIWQKLRMPRSYDYETTRAKRYDERLRMPRFSLDAAQREAVITFILGLTNEAPAERYIYKPDRRQEAIVQGRHVLDKFNCAGCHVLDMERWDIAFEPEWFGDPPPPASAPFPFLTPQVTDEQLAASLQVDRRGLRHATLHGMPLRDDETGEPQLVDEDGLPLEADDYESDPFFVFQLYQDTALEGAAWPVGEENPMVPAERDGSGPARGMRYPAKGGDLAKYLYPRVIADERALNPAVVPTEAWGWLPPPLHHQGGKVQTDWLHDFLMDPTRIRPAAVMRMPNFHMTSDEAAKLVDYFAAMGNAEFPYEYNERRRGGYLARLESAHPELLDDAMRVVTDGNYCVKCHSVGDYQVRGSVKTLGPDLDQVYRRLRPDYVRRWIARPARILPYTGMPINIPFDPDAPHHGGVSQQLFPGTSVSQLDGVVDVLMNFDEYTKRQTSVRGLVREPTETEPAASREPPEGRAAESGG